VSLLCWLSLLLATAELNPLAERRRGDPFVISLLRPAIRSPESIPSAAAFPGEPAVAAGLPLETPA